MRVRLLQSVLVVTTLSLAGSASAHFELLAPTPSKASDMSGGKGGKPCGPDDASAVVTPITGGSMLELKINETTFHPGHYRVALVKSRDELTNLKEPDVKNQAGMVITDGNSFSAVIQAPPVFPVIADGILAHTDKGGMMTAMVAIPNINCDKCTLQVIEFMAQHGPDYYYRHCADLKITADAGKPIFDPSGGSGGGGSGGAAGSGAGGSAGATSGGAGGAPGTAGSASAGTPGASGSTSAGATAGTAGTTAGTGAGGSAGVTPPASAPDDGGCSVARAASDERRSLAALAGSLLLGLGWFARRRNRPE